MHNIQNNHINNSTDGAKMYLTTTATVIYNMLQYIVLVYLHKHIFTLGILDINFC